ncbi:MAG: hypothetical protein ACI4EW_10380 [Butyrivibrio sp.]
MDKTNYSTKKLYDIVSRCESLEEYREILHSLKSQKDEWVIKINEILKESKHSAVDFAKLCEVSRITVQKWKNGSVPKNRETFIKIGFAAGYGLDEMNNFLERYGRCTKLYARNLEDSVCIFVLTTEEIEHTYEKCKMIIDLINKEIQGQAIENKIMYETSGVLLNLINMRKLGELVEFIRKNAGLFSNQYSKFYSYVELYINLNKIGDTSNRDNISIMTTDCSSSLKHCIYDIVNRKWYPKRNKIISLGIHLNMNTDQINEMLVLANMEKLCAKNPFENSIIYALENAMLEDIIFCGTDTLRLYVKDILISLGFSDVEFLLGEAADSVSDDMF